MTRKPEEIIVRLTLWFCFESHLFFVNLKSGLTTFLYDVKDSETSLLGVQLLLFELFYLYMLFRGTDFATL